MDPAKRSEQTQNVTPAENHTSSNPISSQLQKLPDLAEKGKQFFKAAIQSGSSTFDKVKNYFGNVSKLDSAKYKEAVLSQLPESDFKNQIKELKTVGEIRAKLHSIGDGFGAAEGNAIDAVATNTGRTRTISQDVTHLKENVQTTSKKAVTTIKEHAPISNDAKLKKDILSNIDKELEKGPSENLSELRKNVSDANTVNTMRYAVTKYRVLEKVDTTFETPKPAKPPTANAPKVDAQKYKASVLASLDRAKGEAEIYDESTRPHETLERTIKFLDDPDDIREALEDLDHFDATDADEFATDASKYTNHLENLQEAAKTAIEKIKNIKMPF